MKRWQETLLLAAACATVVDAPQWAAAAPQTERSGLQSLMARLASEHPSTSKSAPEASEGAVRLSAAQLDRLAVACAPTTPARIIAAIVHAESSGYPLALAINGIPRKHYKPATLHQALTLATQFQIDGRNFDIGLMQINSANLRSLHLTAAQALQPCSNIRAGAELFERGYAAAMARRAPTVPLLSAYAIYNSGDAVRGYANGYANAVEAHYKSRS